MTSEGRIDYVLSDVDELIQLGLRRKRIRLTQHPHLDEEVAAWLYLRGFSPIRDCGSRGNVFPYWTRSRNRLRWKAKDLTDAECVRRYLKL